MHVTPPFAIPAQEVHHAVHAVRVHLRLCFFIGGERRFCQNSQNGLDNGGVHYVSFRRATRPQGAHT